MFLLFVSLLSIIILYFAIALLPIRICAICAAVSLTWLSLLAGYFLGWHDNILLLSILMGGSVVGLMYKTERYFQVKDLTNFWLVRILIIVFGVAAVYLFLGREWDAFWLLAVISVIAAFSTLFFVKKKDVSAKNGKLSEKLEHCCD